MTDYDYMGRKPESGWVILIGIVLTIAIGVAVCWFQYYQLGLQSEVYARQGIQVSRWELFMGANPSPQMKVKP